MKYFKTLKVFTGKIFYKILAFFKAGEAKNIGQYLSETQMQLIKLDGSLSFAQFGEDIMIKRFFENLSIDKPSYIDIGAYHPYKYNNTALFYLFGSRGVNVEPNPDMHYLFLEHRKDDINLNIGVTGSKKGSLTYYVFEADTLNTFSKTEADKYQKKSGHKLIGTKKIKVVTLSEIIKEHLKNEAPDFLSVDVEGLDYEIISSLNFNEHKPKIICVETIEYTDGKKDMELIGLLENNGYKKLGDTRINTIFADTKVW